MLGSPSRCAKYCVPCLLMETFSFRLPLPETTLATTMGSPPPFSANLTHQFVVNDPIEEFLQVEINAPAAAFGNILLRLCHRLMGRPSRSEPIAVIGKRPVPLPLENLHHRLLDESVQHRRNAKLAHPSVRFGDFNPPHRLRLIGSAQQLFPDGWPVLLQIVGYSIDSHPVDARTTLVGLPPP